VGKGSIIVGNDSFVADFDKMFPELLPGNIYVALSGGVESTIVYHLALKFYGSNVVIPTTYRYGDRRQWEFSNAKRIAGLYGQGDIHKEAGYLDKHASGSINTSSAVEYFNRENNVFNNVRKNDPTFVAGFTGKNTTTLDPECITPEEQQHYLTHFNVHRPLLMMNKVHTVDMYYKLGIESLLEQTYSCQRGGNEHCGDCHACWERIDAFNQLGRKDVVIYKRDYDLISDHVAMFFKTRWPKEAK
jgi:7-cyano-7-deazaguanine synthase in queuosine biosynthesis